MEFAVVDDCWCLDLFNWLMLSPLRCRRRPETRCVVALLAGEASFSHSRRCGDSGCAVAWSTWVQWTTPTRCQTRDKIGSARCRWHWDIGWGRCHHHLIIVIIIHLFVSAAHISTAERRKIRVPLLTTIWTTLVMLSQAV